jgi:hypothetical protein
VRFIGDTKEYNYTVLGDTVFKWHMACLRVGYHRTSIQLLRKDWSTKICFVGKTAFSPIILSLTKEQKQSRANDLRTCVDYI